jgi:hypothetical protein
MIVNNNQTSNNTGFSCGTVRTDGIALQVVNGVALTNGLPTTNGTQLMVVVGSGNVGIGTNNPTEKLHVVGTIGVFGPENNQAGYITTTGESTINNKINIVANRGSGGIVFSTNNGGIAEQLRITTTGNLGIGTNSPDNKIHLYTSTAQSNIDINDYLPTSFSQDIIIERQQSSVTDGIYGKQGPSIDFRATDATDKWSCGSIVGLVDPFGGSSYDGGLAFYTSPGGTVNHNDSRTKGGLLIPALTLGHDQRAYFTGNVGIGSTNPGNKLDVNGKIQTTNFAMTSGAQNGYVLTSDGSGNASWSSISSDTTLISDTDGDTRITVEAVVDEDRIRFVTNGTERMLIGSTGNIGIGITNPSTKLEINGNCTATQFITLSDLNEKQNIKLLSSQKCIDTVKNINLYEFEYKNNQHSSIGVIAQEIEEMFPQAVVINENGTRYVNYQMLFILMFGCIKELIHLKN